jgi:ankyrin repeat protein
MFNKNIDTKFNQIDISIDNYYENPYKFNMTNYDNFTNILEYNSNNNLNLSSIVKNLTSVIMSNSNISIYQNNTNNYTDDLLSDDNIKKNQNSVSTENNLKIFDNTLFKLIANNKNNELKKSIKKFNCNQQDLDGDTPLHIAIFLCNYEAIKILIENNANLFIKDKWGQISSHRMCFCLEDENLLKVIELICKKQNENNINNLSVFNIQDNFGNTPFHLILKYIIKNNIKITSKHQKIFLKLKKLTDNNIKNNVDETVLILFNSLKF